MVGRWIRFLGSLLQRGNLRLTMPDGVTFIFGDGNGRSVAARPTTSAAVCRILLDPDMGLGESYMDGTIAMERAQSLISWRSCCTRTTGSTKEIPYRSSWFNS